ncbi:hypothetical protein [Aminobacter sp. AP02]|uniref:hypothetical protein n=1 Tax=Aminobacter sp. AP02 TaxID=2135737 RepID=UPI000D6CB300|nr:hypothetical protein [Aminobacter sp. AP02]PWK66941.1 hypothetical protein C8K44_11357 [Aminobacter sp. AP02]
MSEDPNKPGQASIAAARAEGEAAGRKAVKERFASIAGDEKLRSDARLMGAALDLAAKNDSMSGDDVVAFVTANVAPTPKQSLSAAALANRIAADGSDPLGSFGGSPFPVASAESTGWADAFARAGGSQGSVR